MIWAPLLAATAVAQAPTPRSLGISNADYPVDAIRQQEEGVVWVAILIKPDGEPESCSRLSSSGSVSLDAISCPLFLARSSFHPAVLPTGERAYGYVILPVRWQLPNRSPRPLPAARLDPDLEVSVNQLPAGGSEEPVQVVAVFDRAGRVTSCSPGADAPDAPAELACRVLPDLLPATPLTTEEGVNVSYVRPLRVRFAVDH